MHRHGPKAATEATGDATLAVLEPPDAILRMGAVQLRTGLGRSTIYRLMAAKQFPAPVRLTGRAIGWRSVDIDRWSSSLVTVTH